MSYDIFIGIDYSGALSPTSRLKSLQVYAARPGSAPENQSSPTRSNNGQPVNWTRKEIAHHLIGLTQRGERFIAGIDHGFSMPLSYFERYGLGDWPAFLVDFVKYWPTDDDHNYVDFVRDGAVHRRGGPAPGVRVGRAERIAPVRALDLVGEERVPVRRSGLGGKVHARRYPMAEAHPR